MSKSPLIEMIAPGARYNQLTLTGEYRIAIRSHILVKVVCDCGTIAEKRFTEIRSGVAKTCGKGLCREKAVCLPIKQGDRYGFLTLTGNYFIKKGVRWLEAVCDCGEIVWRRLGSIRYGSTTSCGCYHRKRLVEDKITHGQTVGRLFHPTYNTWGGLKARCNNPACHAYGDYGGRGIKICKGWEENFTAFYEWSLSNGWAKGLTVDRIDNDGNYSCGQCEECKKNGWVMNCRWATRMVQSRNKRNNVYATAFGETKCLTDWASDERCTVSFTSLSDRLKKGISPEKAISDPPTRRFKN